MNTQSEFDFLKDQVSRLNGVLSYYHDWNLEKIEKTGSNDLKLILTSHIAPLLVEYDRIIYDLRSKLKANEAFIKQEQIRVAPIVNENERLWKLVNERKGPMQTPRLSSAYENIQKQAESLAQEKKALEELVTISDIEINRLQSIITEHDMKPQTMIFNEKMEEIKQRYQGSISELEREVAGLRERNRELGTELGKVRKQLSDNERDSTVLCEKLKFEKEAAEETLHQLNSSLKRIEFMDKEKKQLMTDIDYLKSNLRNHETTKTEWNVALENLECRYRDKEQQIYEVSQKLKEAYQIAEEVNADKKASEIRELQATNECERLRGVINGILEDAGARTREEVDLARESCEKEVERIVEELNLCEQNRQDLLAEIDQVKRSKTQLEQEMELFHRAEREKTLQDLSSAEVSHERMMRAESERESLLLQRDSMENNLKKEKMDNQRVKDSLEMEISSLRNQISQLQASCDKAQANADRFAKLLNTSEESMSQARRKYQESLKKGRHDYEILKQSYHIKQQELETRLSSTEETQRHSTTEMRQILHKQQQLTNKWKEEAHVLCAQYEDRMNQLTKELDREKLRNNEMVALLRESKQEILESHEQMEEKNKTIDLLNSRLRILDGQDGEKMELGNGDSLSSNDNNWQLKHIKKQQQKMIRDSVARKYFIP